MRNASLSGSRETREWVPRAHEGQERSETVRDAFNDFKIDLRRTTVQYDPQANGMADTSVGRHGQRLQAIVTPGWSSQGIVGRGHHVHQ